MKKNFSPILVALSLLAVLRHGDAQIYTYSTLAGQPGINGLGTNNGVGSAAQFSEPYDVAVDSSNYVYVADSLNSEIRKISPAGVVTTLAGMAGTFNSGTNNGTGSHARFSYPVGVAVDKSGAVYVADTGNNAIRKITPGGVVSTLAGLPGTGSSGTNDGTGGAARFWGPNGIAVDSSNYVYVADTLNNTIRKITPGGDVTTLAGQPGIEGASNGVGSAAQFYSPRGLAVDGSGNVFVADTANTAIRMITPGGLVTTFAGLPGHNGYLDATGTNARFYQPDDVAVDSSNYVYVADTANNMIRKITPGGVVSTIGSAYEDAGSSNGVGSMAEFSGPAGIAVSSSGVLYIADEQNNEIREGVPAGVTYPSSVSITTSASPSDGGTTSGSGSVSSGTSVTVSAQANNGFEFVNWTVGDAIVSTGQDYTFDASTDEALVANFRSSTSTGNISVTTSASPPSAGTTTGGGSFPTGSSVTVTANATNGCYVFKEWTSAGAKVSTENPYVFTTGAKNEALVAVFTQLEYTITTSSSPAKGGTTSGGGTKACGATATITAHANSGFAFVDWVIVGDTNDTIPTATCKITVTGNESFVANFRDTKPPTIAITAPGKSEKIATAAFPIEGTASDNVGVAAVYYSLNGGVWTIATPTESYSNWYAWVTLKPDSANTVSAYAVDKASNKSTNTVNFVCTSAGLAPLSIAGLQAAVTDGTNTEASYFVSYDSAGIVRISPNTNGGGVVGTYTYTPTGPDTAELVRNGLFPTPDNGTNELTFSDAYTASYTDNLGGSGTFSFAVSEDIVPTTLDGSTLVATSLMNTNYMSTNTFGPSTYTSEDTSGTVLSGTYTFTKFTGVGALIIETPASPASAVGTTNYIVLWFNEGASTVSGYYDYGTVTATASEGPDTGTFVVNLGTDNTKFLGPATLSGLQIVVTPKDEPFFTRSFGNGTYASISSATNEPSDVGIYLANPRVSANTGSDQFTALAPPYAVGQDDETVTITFSSATKATYVVDGFPVETGMLTYSKAATTAPAAITGHTLTAIPTEKGETTFAVSFTNQTFTVTTGSASSGTYTYAAYSPAMALVQVNFISGNSAPGTGYLVLNFVSTAAGTFVSSKPDPSSTSGWKYTLGNFTFVTTK